MARRVRLLACGLGLSTSVVALTQVAFATPLRPDGARADFGQPARSLDWAVGPDRSLQVAFDADEVTIHAADAESGTTGFRVRRLGYGGSTHDLPSAEPVVQNGTVRYDRGRVTEWYVADERGLEQGFTIHQRQDGGAGFSTDGCGPLAIEMELLGDLEPRVQSAGELALCRGPLTVMRYAGLAAFDAMQRSLPARMVQNGRTLRLEVDDHEAFYPITIDPIVVLDARRLSAQNPTALSYLGGSAAASGDTFVSGARFFTGASPQQGAAYVFQNDGGAWSQGVRLVAGDPSTGAYFGSSVAIDGDTLVVGAPFDSLNGVPFQGSAYVFTRSGGQWTPQAKLVPSSAWASALFGYSVAIQGDTIAIGGSGEQGPLGENSQGAVWIFVRSAGVWDEWAKLYASDGAASDSFGAAIALAGNMLVVGAPSANGPGGSNQGAAYVFSGAVANWTEEGKLQHDEALPGDFFGYAVGASGDSVIVGAPGELGGANSLRGAAFVYRRNGVAWTSQGRISQGQVDGQRVGFSVAIEGDVTLVGCPGAAGAAGAGQGGVKVCSRSGSTWSYETSLQSLVQPWLSAGDSFGSAVAIQNGRVAVGANGDDGSAGSNEGAVYAFRITSCAAVAITSEPADANVCSGDDATFSVAATGGTLTYQWRKDGIDLTGETSATLSLTTVTRASAGGYSVVVSNGCTSATSRAAQLEVHVIDGDADQDGDVDQDDLDLVLFGFGENVPPWTGGDVNGDGLVNQDDLDQVLFDFGVTCGGSPPCDGDVDGNRVVDQDDLDIILFNFGTLVPPGTLGDLDGNGTVDQDDLDLVLFHFGVTCA